MTKISSTKQNGYYEYKPVYVSQLPIVSINNEELDSKAKEILSLKKLNPFADTSNLEKEIDQLVYALYRLSEEEIEIVEGK